MNNPPINNKLNKLREIILGYRSSVKSLEQPKNLSLSGCLVYWIQIPFINGGITKKKKIIAREEYSSKSVMFL